MSAKVAARRASETDTQDDNHGAPVDSSSARPTNGERASSVGEVGMSGNDNEKGVNDQDRTLVSDTENEEHNDPEKGTLPIVDPGSVPSQDSNIVTWDGPNDP